MTRRSSRKGRANSAIENAKRAREIRDLIKTHTMVGATVLTGLLICAFTAYGMIWDDRELLSEVWSLVKRVVVALIAWAGGGGLLRTLSGVKFEGDRAQPPKKIVRIRRDH